MVVILYGPSQVGANIPALASLVLPTTFHSTKSPTLNSLLFTFLLYRQASFCWYLASRMVANSRHSSNRSNYFTINLSFLVGTNPVTWVLHKFTSTDITASTLYIRENVVSPVYLLGIVQYAHKTLGSSLSYVPLAPSNLFFNLFIIALLVASAWPLLCGYIGVEYLFLILRSLQNLQKALLSNCNPLSDPKDSGTSNLVTMFLHTNFLTSTSWILANVSTSAHLVK